MSKRGEDKRADLTGIPQRFRESQLSDYVVSRRENGRLIQDPHKKAVQEVMKKYLADLPQHLWKDGKGLFFIGAPGSGKTMLASIVLNAVRALPADTVREHTGRLKPPTGLFVTFHEYVRRQISQIRLENVWAKASSLDGSDAFAEWEENKRFLDGIMMKSMVAIDDVGKEHHTNTHYAEDEFDFLIRHRFDLGLPTILTSNISPDEEGWNTVYNGSMLSFLSEAFVWVNTEGGTDFRLGQYEGTPLRRAPRGRR